MTDVTTSQGHDEPELSAADEQLLRELTERARAGGLKLTGEGGLLGRLTKMVVEGALEGELDDHLGYEKNDRHCCIERVRDHDAVNSPAKCGARARQAGEIAHPATSSTHQREIFLSDDHEIA